MSLLRSSVYRFARASAPRSGAAAPALKEGELMPLPPPRAKVDARTGGYPYRHRELGGYHVYPGQAPYSIIEVGGLLCWGDLGIV